MEQFGPVFKKYNIDMKDFKVRAGGDLDKMDANQAEEMAKEMREGMLAEMVKKKGAVDGGEGAAAAAAAASAGGGGSGPGGETTKAKSTKTAAEEKAEVDAMIQQAMDEVGAEFDEAQSFAEVDNGEPFKWGMETRGGVDAGAGGGGDATGDAPGTQRQVIRPNLSKQVDDDALCADVQAWLSKDMPPGARMKLEIDLSVNGEDLIAR
jgi:hypothetical protein